MSTFSDSHEGLSTSFGGAAFATASQSRAHQGAGLPPIQRTIPTLCPCDSDMPYTRCCGPFLDGEPAPTPEALMRSRYTAYVLGDQDHLFRSWHPATRPEPPYCDADTRWLGLQIIEAPAPVGTRGFVEFIASYQESGGKVRQMRERSAFQRRGSRWVYVDGELS